jgi:SSS family solute:Na+ symporter
MSIVGGLGAVVISDTIQAVVLIIGGTMVAIAAFMAIPSWEALTQTVDPGMLSIIQPADDPNLPWPGLFTGLIIIGFYFWVTNQMMVQRVLGARSLDHGRWGSIFAGFLKIPILFLMILPGTMAILIFPELPRADLVFPTLVNELMPVGIRGIILAALVAAITSSVDSILNSASTLVTMDFVKTTKPEVSDRALVIVGRITTTIVMIVAIIWAPQIAQFPTLWDYLQSVLSYMTPPIVSMFIVGIFWKRATRHGAFATLAIGVPLGIVGFITIGIFEMVELHFLYAAAILFVISIVILVSVSLMTAPEDDAKLSDLVWRPHMWHAETRELEGKPLWQNYRFQAGMLALCTAAVVIWFW